MAIYDMVRLGLEVISTSAKDEKLSFLSSSYQKCRLHFPPAVTIPGLFCLSLPAHWPSQPASSPKFVAYGFLFTHLSLARGKLRHAWAWLWWCYESARRESRPARFEES